MTLIESQMIRRLMAAAVCLTLMAVSDAWAQVGQESVVVEGTSANPAESAADAPATGDSSSNAAQAAGTAENTAAAGDEQQDQSEQAKTGKSEVEYNEDNYRRFMELKDQNRRSSAMPTNIYKPGTQKLDELPEESQKHLRNELRSIIVQQGEWQEGDENNQYAYVPSEAAKKNSELQKLEAEAWNELVGKYQEREAQIHANSARSEAARQASAAGGGSPDKGRQQGQNGSSGQQGQAGQEGESQGGQSSQSGAQNQQQNQNQEASSSSKDSYSPDEAAKQQDNARDEGVSENALQFLTQGQQGQTGGLSQPPSGDRTGQGSNQQQEQQSRQPSDQQSDEQSQRQSGGTSTSQQSGQAGTDAQVADGEQGSETTSKKASSSARLENQTVAEASSKLEQDEDGTTQNAFEQLRGNSQQDNIQQEETPPGTLLIRDLINAQGVVVEDQQSQTDGSQSVPDVEILEVDPDTN